MKKKELSANDLQLIAYNEKLTMHLNNLSKLIEQRDNYFNGIGNVDLVSVISKINAERAIIKNIDYQIMELQCIIEPTKRQYYENEFNRRYA